MGISSSLIAAAIVYWIVEQKLIAALIIGGAGIAGFLITHFLTKRPPPTVPPSVNQENIQTFNPQFNPTFNPQQNVYVGTRDDEAERERKERARHDQMVFDHIKQQHDHRPNMTHLVADVASAVSLNFYETDQSLKRLFATGMLYRGNIDAPGDYVYWFRGDD